jgi:altronate hydrolase
MPGNEAQRRVLQLDARDNALVALTDLCKGETVNFAGKEYLLLADVPAKHKFVTEDLPAGGEVIMYGVLVGRTVEPLHRGGLLSTRNLRHAAAAFHDRDSVPHWSPPDVSRWRERTFLGYHRADGLVGTRNYWIVLPLVFCENRNLAVLKQAFEEELGFAAPQIYRRQVAEMVRLYRQGKGEDLRSVAITENTPAAPAARVFRNVDGIKFLMHEGGCGGTREDSANLCALLAGYIHHPNVAGATVLSLGCQHAQVTTLQEEIQRRDPHFSKPLLVFEQQKTASEASMISQAIRETFLGLVEAD